MIKAILEMELNAEPSTPLQQACPQPACEQMRRRVQLYHALTFLDWSACSLDIFLRG